MNKLIMSYCQLRYGHPTERHDSVVSLVKGALENQAWVDFLRWSDLEEISGVPMEEFSQYHRGVVKPKVRKVLLQMLEPPKEVNLDDYL